METQFEARVAYMGDAEANSIISQISALRSEMSELKKDVVPPAPTVALSDFMQLFNRPTATPSLDEMWGLDPKPAGKKPKRHHKSKPPLVLRRPR